jgi:hypothetical protein
MNKAHVSPQFSRAMFRHGNDQVTEGHLFGLILRRSRSGAEGMAARSRGAVLVQFRPNVSPGSSPRNIAETGEGYRGVVAWGCGGRWKPCASIALIGIRETANAAIANKARRVAAKVEKRPRGVDSIKRRYGDHRARP